ncbi:hypothetical protein [Methanoculleus sp.]|uniref:hypothetical protein n=1 Tax=Methanoculleus sp. TaxID=90427 RepID=UPI0025FF1BB3|nr:hypothetical protein [Methanoculleus sp.]
MGEWIDRACARVDPATVPEISGKSPGLVQAQEHNVYMHVSATLCPARVNRVPVATLRSGQGPGMGAEILREFLLRDLKQEHNVYMQ